MPLAEGNWKWNSEFCKKGELEENTIYSLKPIEDVKLSLHRIKK